MSAAANLASKGKLVTIVFGVGDDDSSRVGLGFLSAPYA